ncbi:MAG: hypothetical protein FWE13_02335 [Firmicutes bacterium]|nr:hypothetical protein [Bacillota bacterium]
MISKVKSKRIKVERDRLKTAVDAVMANSRLGQANEIIGTDEVDYTQIELTEEFIEEKVNEVKRDFEKRCMERRGLEAQWQVNSNFVLGNQFCSIMPNSGVEDIDREFFWQEREAFNHIAPIFETRLAKLGRVRPKMSVRPSSDDENDIRTAKTASKILSSVGSTLELDRIVQSATMWSELCGSSFYKLSWDNLAGKNIGSVAGRNIFEGEIRVDVCPPFEVYPSSLMVDDLDKLESIIHAKAVPMEQVARIYGVEVEEGEDVSVFGLSSFSSGGLSLRGTVNGISRTKADGHCLVIERYTRPTPLNPNGELCIIAGNKLLYLGELPYLNGIHGTPDFPFIKQDCIKRAGSFFGTSVIERLIPIQRAYNAVKNRKHEFLNRISMGILAVEDGSVDVNNLEMEGLAPGKILVYRQGGAVPRLLETGRVPIDFTQEEDRLFNEFMSISGVSEIMRTSMPMTNLSGVAIQLLIEQDDTRLSITAEHIRFAIRNIGRQVLRLYKQFAGSGRLSRVVGDSGEVELLYWNKSDITCDDVVMETQNEISSTPAVRQSMMFDLIRMGLLSDEDGKISDASRYKILDTLGYGGWEFLRDLESLNINKAAKENLEFYKLDTIEVSEIDRHDLHIIEHTKFGLTAEFDRLVSKKPEIKERLLQHIRQHKKFDKLSAVAEGEVVI